MIMKNLNCTSKQSNIFSEYTKILPTWSKAKGQHLKDYSDYASSINGIGITKEEILH